MNRILGIALVMCAVATGCGKKNVAIVKMGQREAAILKCANDFKTALSATVFNRSAPHNLR